MLCSPALWAATDTQTRAAAQCAGFWLGYHDYGRISAYLDADAADIARANAFRAVAMRLGTSSPGDIDAFIAHQRGQMILLMDAVVYQRDRSSQRVFEDLSETCDRLAGLHPETRSLR